MKKKILAMFLVLQLLIVSTDVLNLSKSIFDIDLFLTIKGFIIIYSFIFIVFLRDRTKKFKFSYIFLFTLIAITAIFQKNYFESLTNNLYLLSTTTFLISYYENLNIKKYQYINLSKALLLLLTIYILITKEINITSILVINMLYPISILYYDKDKLSFILLTSLTILVGVLNDATLIFYNLIIISTIIFIHSFKTINNRVLSTLFLFTIFLISFIKDIFLHNLGINVTFSVYSLLTMTPIVLLTITMTYYVFKEKKIFDLVLSLNLYIVVVATAILLISIDDFYYPTTVILYSYLIVILVNQLKLKTRNLEDKVTILALHLGYGGIEQYISSLTKMIEKEITIVSTYKLYSFPPFDYNNSKIIYLINYGPNKEDFKKALKEKRVANIFKEGLKSLKILYLKKYENIETIEKINTKYIITTRDFHNEYVGLFSRKDSIQISTEHNYHNNDKKYIKTLLNSVKNSDYFVLVSKYLKDYYENKTETNVVYIPNVLEDMPKKTTKNKSHNLISVGRLSKVKAQEDLINLVEILKKKYNDITLTIVGDGEEKNNLEQLINKKKLNKNVLITGFLNKDEIEKELLKNNIFVTTSKSESFGLVAIEAASYKLPVVAFDTALGLKEILENENGVLVKDRDIKKMSKEIEKLFEDEKYRNKIAENGYKNSQKYLMKNVKDMWKNIIN